MNKLKRIFSKISTFDLIIMTVLIIIIVFFFFFFYRKSEYVIIRVKETDPEILYARSQPQSWYANHFEVGDQEKDSLGKTVAEIIAVDKFNVSSEKKAVYLDLKIKALYDTRTKLYSARGKPLIVGTPLKINFSKVIFEGIVTEAPDTSDQKKYRIKNFKVTALARGVNELQTKVVWGPNEFQSMQDFAVIEPEVIDNIKKGDQIIDSKKLVLAEIIDVKIKSAQRITKTDSGELIIAEDPYYKDAILTVNVKAKSFESENFIFDNLPLKLGEKLPLNFKDLSIFPTIIEIEEN